MSKSTFKKAMIGAAAALTIGGGMLATSAPASAQVVVSGYRHVGGHHYYGHRPYYGYRHSYRRNNGAAVAAGLIGGLALGAIAANSYNYGGYGYGGYAPVTYGYGYAPVRRYVPARHYGYAPVSYGYGDCFIERRIRVNRFGERVVRDVQVCR
jgi:hypothetical protein